MTQAFAVWGCPRQRTTIQTFLVWGYDPSLCGVVARNRNRRICGVVLSRANIYDQRLSGVGLLRARIHDPRL